VKHTKAQIIICLIILNILSVLSLFSALHQAGELKNIHILYRQIIWIAIAWGVFVTFCFIDYKVYYDVSIPLYIVGILFLVLVKLFGKEIMGAKRWFSFFGVHFQPSEFSKLVIILLLGRLFSGVLETKQVFLNKVLIPLGLVLLNALLIFIQPDLGTALISIFIFILVGFSSRLRKGYLLIPLVLSLLCSPLGWNALKDYQKKRLLVFLNPNVEPLGAGYTIIQSKIAIGSGKLMGKGFLSGTQNQFNFLPERHTDFIFTVIAEEWGFVGSLFLLILYYIILKHILSITKEAKDEFAALLCVGVASLYFLHIFINIGMTLGILPVVGLPLLFLSYGGTHLVISFLLLGIVFNVATQSKQ
jgi:rod shape determining protein RodA